MLGGFILRFIKFIKFIELSMWLFCCGMYRSASTLQFQVTARLVTSAGVGDQIGWIDFRRFSDIKAQHAEHTGYQVIKVHQCSDAIATEFAQNNAVGVYTYRDIRDVYVSSMQQRQKTFEQVWQENFLQQCLENHRHWLELPRVLVSKYIDLTTHLPQEIQRIANHLGITLTADQAAQIAADYAPNQQRARIEQFRQRLLLTPRDPNDHRELVDYHDETNLLHMNHIHSGENGRWREALSMAQVAAIESQVMDWCTQHQWDAAVFLS